jgi:(E)-4-hydroxy-3-methylbut-2-enyl-diphosphate synthase
VYRNGEKSHLIDTKQLADEIEKMVREKAEVLRQQRENEILRVQG